MKEFSCEHKWQNNDVFAPDFIFVLKDKFKSIY